MKIGIDTRLIKNSGIGTTIRGLLGHMSSDKKEHMHLFGESVEGYASTICHQKIYGIGQHLMYGRFLNRQNLDLFHMPHYDFPLMYQGKLVVTVHDLIHYLFPQYSTKPFSKIYAGFMLKQVAKRAAWIIVDSKNTKKDFLSLFPQAERKISVVYPAVGKEFGRKEDAEIKTVLDRLNIVAPYFLYVGNIRESKNSRNLIDGYRRAKKKNSTLPKLVLAGKNSLVNFEVDRPDVQLLGAVYQDDLPALYSGATAFLFPSLYEGFGLPPLEAMACGTPVITSNVSSLPEVCADAALYVDPQSVESIEKAILDIYQSPVMREELVQKSKRQVRLFGWEKFADETWSIYMSVLKREAK